MSDTKLDGLIDAREIARTICDHERGAGAWDSMLVTLDKSQAKRPAPAEARFITLAQAILARHSAIAAERQSGERGEVTGMLSCPFCGSSDVDPEGWTGTTQDPNGETGQHGRACNQCSASADSVEIWNRRASSLPAATDLVAGVSEDDVEAASKVYADATGYYVPFHKGLSSVSSDSIRKGIRAVIAALRAQRDEGAFAEGIAAAVYWHEQRRRDTPDAFEMEFHENSAKTIRSFAAKAELTALRARPNEGTFAERDVLAERERQVSIEGWTPEHDDMHDKGEIGKAAACYALCGSCADNQRAPMLNLADTYGSEAHSAWRRMWPWNLTWWKPKDRRRDLVRAGALIIAEIERLDRRSLTMPEKKGSGE